MALCLDRLVGAEAARPRAARGAALHAARARVLGLPGGHARSRLARGRDRPRPRAAARRWTPRASRARAATRRSAAGRLKGWPVRHRSWAAASSGGRAPGAAGVAVTATGRRRVQPPARGRPARRRASRRRGCARPSRARGHLRRRAHAQLPAPAPRGARRLGRRCATTGRRLLELAARVARDAFDGDARPAVRLPGHAGGGGALGAPRPRPARTSRSRASTPSSTDDGPRFIEINSDAPAGFGYGDRMAEVFARAAALPGVRGRRHPSRYVSSEAAARARPSSRRGARGGRGHARRGHRGLGRGEDARRPGDPARGLLRRAGRRCVLADPRAMEVRGGRLWRRRERVDVVYRRARALRAGRARGRGAGRSSPPTATRSGRLRELLPLPPVRGQGLLRPPHRRGVRAR